MSEIMLRKSFLPFSIIALLLVGSFPTQAADKVLNCGNVLDVESKKLLGPQLITITETMISSITPTGHRAQGAIDLRDQTCLPGLIDMHVHLTSQNSPRSYIERFTLNAADYAFRAADYAEITLNAGFTTVRNLGDDGTVTRSLRGAIARGIAVGPRIFTAGKSLATTGGHADPSNGYRADLMGDPHAKSGVVNAVPRQSRLYANATKKALT